MTDESVGDVVNDFEAWARLSVRLHGRDEPESEALIERLGVASVWSNADDTWAKTLANEMRDLRLDRVRRYAELLAEELLERRILASGDFRHRALYGPPQPSRRDARATGGTPFEDDGLGDDGFEDGGDGDQATRRLRPVTDPSREDGCPTTAVLPRVLVGDDDAETIGDDG